MPQDNRTKAVVFVWLLQVAVVGLTFWHDAGGAPLVAAPIRCLIVEETSERQSLTPGQRAAILSTAPGSVREYLASHCLKDAAGNPEFRLVDKDDSMAKDSKEFQELMALPRTGVPWIVVSNGHGQVSEPLPATAEETLSLLQKWGGK